MDKIYFFLCRELGNRNEAEDATQDIFLKLWQSPHLFDATKGRFKSWLWVVAANHCRDRFRKNKWRHSPDGLENIIDFAPLPDRIAEDQNELAATMKKIKDLPERQQQALFLSLYDELTQKEIAATMGVSVGAVESLLSRARSTLKASLKKKSPLKEIANA